MKNVCTEIWNSLQPTYMPTSTEAIWRQRKLVIEKYGTFPTAWEVSTENILLSNVLLIADQIIFVVKIFLDCSARNRGSIL